MMRNALDKFTFTICYIVTREELNNEQELFREHIDLREIVFCILKHAVDYDYFHPR